MPEIGAIIFDLDDTLWDFQAAQRQVTTNVVARAAIEEPRLESLDTESILSIRRELGRTTTTDDVVALRRETFRLAIAGVGVVDDRLVEQLTEAFLDGLTRDLPLFGDTIEVLEWCQLRYRLGAVSNGTKGAEAGGIADYFETTVLGPIEGIVKPDPRLFVLAMQRMGSLDPGQVVAVGDNDRLDVAGAHAAGMRSVLVDRSGTGSTLADAVIDELNELPEVLEAW